MIIKDKMLKDYEFLMKHLMNCYILNCKLEILVVVIKWGYPTL